MSHPQPPHSDNYLNFGVNQTGERGHNSEPMSRRAVLAGGGGAGLLAVQDGEGTEDEETPDEERTEETVTVELVDFAFEPGTDSPLEIPPGTTVQFVWETDTHNIVVDSQPEESEWEGHEPIEDTGFEHEHTFEVEGEYEFYCDPHIAVGMIGEIVVAEGAGEDDEGEAIPVIPSGAVSLALGTIVAMVFVVFMAYFFIKYSGEFEGEP